MTENEIDPRQTTRDGQHEPEVDIESLIGEPVEPDHDLDVETFDEHGNRR